MNFGFQRVIAPWQNPIDSHDTNNDHVVSPLDVLVVINFLNHRGPLELESASDLSFAFLDTNGDGNVGPIDALIVINFLNKSSPLEEGEAVSNQPGNTSDRLSISCVARRDTFEDDGTVGPFYSSYPQLG
ncbi:MAG: dockerin type I domain-containing protein [Pirellulaceae bacterium]